MQSLGKLVQRSLFSQSSSLLAVSSMRFSGHTAECGAGAFSYAVKARVQHPAPHFEGMSFHTDGFKKISLADYKGKYVVLFTYPLDFTFVCPTEIVEFNDKSEEFRKAGKLSIQ